MSGVRGERSSVLGKRCVGAVWHTSALLRMERYDEENFTSVSDRLRPSYMLDY